MTPQIRKIISEGTQSQVVDYLLEQGYKSFPHRARDKILVGTTTLEEALRVLRRQMFSTLQNCK